jgi:hypothetical protein
MEESLPGRAFLFQKGANDNTCIDNYTLHL